jgi:hypothetical protein
MEKQVQKVYNIFFDNAGNLRNVTSQNADVKLAYFGGHIEKPFLDPPPF